MNATDMPGFTAEARLYRTGSYLEVRADGGEHTESGI